jgi:lipoprotein-anchoring transpeptidase ErfK/SrfK
MIARRQFLSRGVASLAATSALFASPSLSIASPEAFPVRYVDPRWMKKKWRRQVVRSPFDQPPGTIVVDARARFLYLIGADNTALRYGIAVGREGFGWSGVSTIERKAKWPSWTSTARMNEETPGMSFQIDGGPGNPLGARALYLYAGGKDTLYRLHGGGTIQTIGNAVSAGCIRMLDQDVIDLYERAPQGTKVIVLDPRNPSMSG